MTSANYVNFLNPFPRRFHIKFGIDWPSRFKEADVRKYQSCTCIYNTIQILYSPVAGAEKPWGKIVFINTINMSNRNMSRDVRKPVFGDFDQDRHKPGWTITVDG